MDEFYLITKTGPGGSIQFLTRSAKWTANHNEALKVKDQREAYNRLSMGQTAWQMRRNGNTNVFRRSAVIERYR